MNQDQQQTESEDVTVQTTSEQPENSVEPDEQNLSGVDDATTEQTEQKVTFDPKQQAKIDQIIGAQVKQTRNAERELETTRAELESTRAKLPKESRPSIPDAPDPFDDDFSEKLKSRDESIKQAAEFDANARFTQRQAEQTHQIQQRQEQTKLVEKVTAYTERAKTLGITDAELKTASDTIGQFGIQDDVVHFILEDDSGPLITDYLSKNPIEMDKLSRMTPMQAASHIAITVKPNAVTARKTTSAPAPATIVDGGGKPSGERGPKGATFA